MKQILSYMRKAINDYDMIQEGDKIAIALSGGKDSTALLMGLKNLQIFFPNKFDIIFPKEKSEEEELDELFAKHLEDIKKDNHNLDDNDKI